MKTRTEQISEFIEGLNIENLDLTDFINGDEVDNYDDILDTLEDNNAFNVDVIYYHTALKFLMENDPSLLESTELAHDLGYQVRDINSELLASLLASEKCRNEFYEKENEINEFFDELEQNEAA